MGVIFTHDFTDDARGFHIFSIPVKSTLVHRVEDTPMNRLQTIAHIRQRPADDYAHGVVEIGALHFLHDGDRLYAWRTRGRINWSVIF